MSKVLKSQGKMGDGQLIENQPAGSARPVRGRSGASTPTPLPGPAGRRAARDPRGGLARAFPLPPAERTCSGFQKARGAGV